MKSISDLEQFLLRGAAGKECTLYVEHKAGTLFPFEAIAYVEGARLALGMGKTLTDAAHNMAEDLRARVVKG